MTTKKEALKRYMELEQQLKDYRDQFMGKGWVDGKFDEPKKVMTPGEIEKLKTMKKKVEEAREEYLKAEKID